jgi:NADH dehydrogenase
MKPLSICVLGGTGFLGTRLLAGLIKDGHRVTALSRDREQHKHLLVLPGLTLENGDVYDAAQLSEHFRGKDVVINLVGILNERGFGGGGFRRAHTELTRAVLQAMRSAGAPRLLQVSALKAATDAPSYYLRSKGEAEKLIRESGANLDWTIFQPSVMFGPGDSFLNRFATLLASVPFAFPLARPNARFQPVLVDDVIEALRRCLRGGAGSRQTYELGGPRVYTLREIVELVAKLTGQRRWIIGLPDIAARLQGLVMNFVPGRPFSTDNYRSLTVDSVCAADGFARLGIKPQSMIASARQYLGALEDNARLSHNRAAAGRASARPATARPVKAAAIPTGSSAAAVAAANNRAAMRP